MSIFGTKLSLTIELFSCCHPVAWSLSPQHVYPHIYTPLGRTHKGHAFCSLSAYFLSSRTPTFVTVLLLLIHCHLELVSLSQVAPKEPLATKFPFVHSRTHSNPPCGRSILRESISIHRRTCPYSHHDHFPSEALRSGNSLCKCQLCPFRGETKHSYA